MKAPALRIRLGAGSALCQPQRNLTFDRPGHEATGLLRSLVASGLPVSVSFSNHSRSKYGFEITQEEHGKLAVIVIINLAHPHLDLQKLTISFSQKSAPRR